MERSEPRMLGQEAQGWWDKEASVASPARVAGFFSSGRLDGTSFVDVFEKRN
ncbi:hypothetical protein [Chromohalobacter sp.]|uniref:hypothetical protein n=1 Tax=Chromohalobacter sp. TaxID=50740 RepID=UPI001D6F935F|nr:hypothetical protein [Chromohalobacter sp.]NQY44628.1 hypothetical protein [Chromohalobacter sp.]